ncbi:SAM-dependent methyltransferase [Paenalcaligenes niemegkensis]|uniref:class I SAM-dependent methyltransferase n=1 Tax=Paenalcaligenes niemegkensis TaxID=2895469 RepID=UPI001EE97EC3|nr:SAM-dependent methyltransferase [Paenalcaligenes niemegkensis]MCQ9617473.1 SAM-dependent methyltransferase [Paenalcaligenes niemegkensis]
MKYLHSPIVPTGLPQLEAELIPQLDINHNYLSEKIEAQQDNFLPFDQWMHQTLYAPNIGYYSGGSTKFGSGLPVGDFTTAPELTPLFGQSLAVQIHQVLSLSQSVEVLEFGAGSGTLAKAIIPALLDLGIDVQYSILEVSPSLKQRQQESLHQFGERVRWLDQLPTDFVGCAIANEVLDAMPVHLIERETAGVFSELGVSLATQPTVSPFTWAAQAANDALARVAEARFPKVDGYRSEINLQAEAWVREIGSWLSKGAVLLFDYGFPQHEYYHEQRAEGTLMCHFRHYAHSEALLFPGLQDITAHVDFTAMADAALEGGLDVMGYTSQARFLMNSGLVQRLEQLAPAGNDSAETARWAQTASAVQKLFSEAEMGELFKVLAVAKEIDGPLIGFLSGDRRDRL